MNSEEFLGLLRQKGAELYRDMPWRRDARPYYVLVSELMLQQTQVERVIPKFGAFIARFPDAQALAAAPLADVLKLWSGLGYNRRAKYLHEAARKIVADYGGVFPDTKEDLASLPGVGPGTAGAILAYAFNHPVLFVETNVRTVYFHHFFPEGDKVSDSQLLEIMRQTVPWGKGKGQFAPREFYWALMDYGTWLKKQGAGRVAQSKHYKKQPALKGSVREVRGQIVRVLAGGDMTLARLRQAVAADERFEVALAGLLRDGLITETDGKLHLTK